MKLPKRVRNHVNPLADLTEHSFTGFDNTNPIIVDIGAYRGEFSEKLLGYFAATRNFIVAEIRKPYAKYLGELFEGNSNVAVFDGDTAKNLKGLLLPSIEKGILIEYIFINFPDPWFKDRHKKRRVVTDTFIKNCRGWIKSETTFIFQTDQHQLFLDTQEILKDQGITYNEFDDPMWNIQSYWEEMKVSEGKKIYRMTFSFQ